MSAIAIIRLANNSSWRELEMLKTVKKCLAMSVMILCLSGGALAGHTMPGGGGAYCMCGCKACFCDPGENPGNCTNSVVGQPKADPSGDTLPKPGSAGDGGAFLFGSVMVMALARLLWPYGCCFT